MHDHSLNVTRSVALGKDCGACPLSYDRTTFSVTPRNRYINIPYRHLGITKQTLKVRPIELVDANAFVAAHHRHHKPVQGHRFSIAAYDDGRICGVCVVGRPVARLAGHPLEVAEVTRLCTDGTANACSFLYGAAARIAKEMGFVRIQTYTLPEEGGGSLRGARWTNAGVAGGGQWKHTDGKPRRTDQPISEKYRWEKQLNDPVVVAAYGDAGLFTVLVQ